MMVLAMFLVIKSNLERLAKKSVIEDLAEISSLEAVLKPGFVAFVDYFGCFSTPKLGGYIPLSILPPIIWIEKTAKIIPKIDRTLDFKQALRRYSWAMKTQ